MTKRTNTAAPLVGLLLAFALSACGGQPATSQPADSSQQEPTAEQTQEQSQDESKQSTDTTDNLDLPEEPDAPTSDDADAPPSDSDDENAVDGFAFEAGTYQMILFNDKDTQAAIDEYLNSGYNAAAYQLVLYDDGGGLLYTGRSFRGVTLTDEGAISINGVAAEASQEEDMITVTCDSDTMVFQAAHGSSGSRIANAALAGRYDQHSEDAGVLDKMRLNDDGTGVYRRAGQKRSTALYWGTEQVFNSDYIIVEGVSYGFTYRRATNSSGVHYDIIIDNEQHTRLSSVDE